MSDHDRPSGGRDLKRQCRGLGMAGKELLTVHLGYRVGGSYKYTGNSQSFSVNVRRGLGFAVVNV